MQAPDDILNRRILSLSKFDSLPLRPAGGRGNPHNWPLGTGEIQYERTSLGAGISARWRLGGLVLTVKSDETAH